MMSGVEGSIAAAAPCTPPRSRSTLDEDPSTPPRSSRGKGRPETPGAPRQSRLSCAVRAARAAEERLQVGEHLEVDVAGLSGRLCAVQAKPSWYVLELKHAVERCAGIPAFEQQLVAEGRELDDDELLQRVLPGTSALVALVRRPPRQAQRLKSIAERQALDLRRSCEAELEETGFDRHVALAYARRDGRLLELMPESLRADRGIVLQAVRRHPAALSHADEQLRADPEVVLAAVWRDPRALAFASEALRADSEFVRAAMQGEDQVERLLIDPKDALERARCILSCAAPGPREDPSLLHAAGLRAKPGSPMGDPQVGRAAAAAWAAAAESPATANFRLCGGGESPVRLQQRAAARRDTRPRSSRSRSRHSTSSRASGRA